MTQVATIETDFLTDISQGNFNLVLDAINNKPLIIDEKLPTGESALWLAIERDDEKLIKLLLEGSGCDVNLPNHVGATPLFVSCEIGNEKIAEWLLESTADPNLVLKGDESSPRNYIAAENACFESLEILIKNGADINLAGKDHATPLFISSNCNFPRIVEFLLKNGADPDKKFCGITSPLYNAAQKASNPEVDAIVIVARLSQFDIIKFTYIVHFEFLISGPTLTNRGYLENAVTINFGSQSKLFPRAVQMQSQDLTFTFTEGDSNNYPLDEFIDAFTISASYADIRVNNSNTPPPIVVEALGSLQGYTIEYGVAESEEIPYSTGFALKLTRSNTTKFFSFLMILTMWCLSASVLILAITLWMRDRKVEPPTIGVTTGLLFALPAIRNVQPGIPGIGCTADVVGLFWNITMVAVASLLLLVNYIKKYKKEKTSLPFTTDQLYIAKQEDIKKSEDASYRESLIFNDEEVQSNKVGDFVNVDK
ncbi:hypothetical protein HK099_006964 [Clydaea vesicula]|uniref:Uncharacterized protein n=1 Tax=Clydaea vesicula TaxID=447962 RepID=A0AAD5TXT6_9FUNG|nr:hypothetical protein HK099_006964 [Clydaea vesicula]